jgi:HSP20 family protein
MLTNSLFRELDNLRREIDDAFRGVRPTGGIFSPDFLPGLGLANYPQVNLSEDENAFHLEALVPGVEPADLDLSVMNRTLTLSGERRESEFKDASCHRNERGSGRFLRTIELPSEVENEAINAEYRNGVLRVTLPKAESAKPRKIAVKAS